MRKKKVLREKARRKKKSCKNRWSTDIFQLSGAKPTHSHEPFSVWNLSMYSDSNVAFLPDIVTKKQLFR